MLETVHHFEPSNLHVMFECDWDLKRTTPEVAKFLEDHPVRPLSRLDPQKSVKAALNEAYTLNFSSEDTEAAPRKAYAADLSSLFPHIALSLECPIGPYFKLVGDEIDPAKVSFGSQDFFYDGKMYTGLLQVRIVPPRGLLHPFLLTTVRDQSLAVLCLTCARKMQQEPCCHNDSQRALTDVWTTAELHFAVTRLGYKILAFFELMLYSERAFILQKFTSLLAFDKIRFSALPKWVDLKNEQDLDRHCSQINAEMQFEERIGKKLTPIDLQPNSQMRIFFKRALVSWVGHFSANLEKRTITHFLDNPDDLSYYACRDQILGMTVINSRYIQVTLTGARRNARQTRQEKEDAVSRKACATVGAFVTSVARVFMYTQMMDLQSKGADILKICCDALYFTLPEMTPNPLLYSESFGFWKQIYPGDLVSLCQMGVCNYAVLYREEGQDQLVSEAKASGLTMLHRLTGGLNYAVYLEAVHAMINDKIFNSKTKLYSQVRRKSDKQTMSITYARRRQSVFSRNVLSRRVIVRELKNHFATRPYGWSE